MRHTSRRSDDADVIRARLRALLDEGSRGGWVPGDDDDRPLPGDDPLPDPGGGYADDPGDGTDDLPAGMGRHRAPGPAVRWDPGRRGARSLWIAGLLAALLLVAWTWVDRPRVEPAPEPATGSTTPAAPTPSPAVGEAAGTATPVVVAVVGLVARPGLVTLPTGARVADALEAAGGLLPGTDPASVNLAALVADGQQIAVGVPGVAGGPSTSPEGGGARGGGAGGGGLVDLNSASAQELDALPGIGPVLAQRIVAHRDEQGPFRSVDQLDDVPGIGPTIFAELAELVTV